MFPNNDLYDVLEARKKNSNKQNTLNRLRFLTVTKFVGVSCLSYDRGNLFVMCLFIAFVCCDTQKIVNPFRQITIATNVIKPKMDAAIKNF